MHAAKAWVTKTFATLSTFAKVTLVLNIGTVEPIGTVDALRADTLLPCLQLSLAGLMALIAALLRDTAPWNAQRRVLMIPSGTACRLIIGWTACRTGEVGLNMSVRAINVDGNASVYTVAFASGVINIDM